MKSITVPGTLDYLGEIAKYVMTAAEHANLERKTAYKLRLAVDEIATNIITHGYQESGQEGFITIEAHMDAETLTITLTDTGVEFDPTIDTPKSELDLPMEQRQIGGLGVYLAMENVDHLLYERKDHQNRNILVVNR